MVPEAQAWKDAKRERLMSWRDHPAIALFVRYPGRVAYLGLLMLVLCFGSWPFQGLLPTYLKSLHMAPGAISWITSASAIGQVCGFFASGFIAERIGRRLALGGMLSIGSLFVAALVFCASSFGIALPLAFLAGFFLVGSSGIWGTVLTENLPREVRASGVGLLYNVGVIGGGMAPFIVLSTIHRADSTLAIGIAVFSIGAALAALVVLKGVRETKGLRLHDIDQA
jgi:SHS family sialic acid transporter-like MFS transporter